LDKAIWDEHPARPAFLQCENQHQVELSTTDPYPAPHPHLPTRASYGSPLSLGTAVEENISHNLNGCGATKGKMDETQHPHTANFKSPGKTCLWLLHVVNSI